MHIVLPQISISPPPPESPSPVPYSPFSPPSESDQLDTFRSVHLTPPPHLTTFVRRPPSPLRPRDSYVPPEGLERDRFDALLQASRERNALVGAKKAVDLRKEITLKAHKTKHDERRARFLSRVLVPPPSPTATLTPKTPPDSPAIFHYSLPSPGLVSPLTLFESMSEDVTGPFSYAREPWIEQVDFRSIKHCVQEELVSPRHPAPRVARPLPSLDQISAHLSAQGHVRTQTENRPKRLPAFLAVHQTPTRDGFAMPGLQTPVDSTPKQSPEYAIEDVPLVPSTPRLLMMSPLKPTFCPVNSRERRALDMLSTIRRRTQVFGDTLAMDADRVDSHTLKWKRYSAPADLQPLQQRTGFEHPVLALPGGF